MNRKMKLYKWHIFLLIIVLATFAYAFGRYIWGGEYFIFSDAGSDCRDEYYPIYVQTIERIRNNNISLWNKVLVLGGDTLTRHEYLMEPFAVILILAGVIFGSQIAAPLLVIMQLLKVLLSVALAYKFLGFFKFQDNVRMLGAYLYGFNSFLMVWGQHYWYGTAGIYLILLLIIIEKWMETAGEKRKWLFWYSVTVGALFIYSVYFGYMSIIMAAAYTGIRFLYRENGDKLSWKRGFRCEAQLMTATLLGMLMAGIMILPFIDIHVVASSRISADSILTRIWNYLIHPYNAEYYTEIFLRMISSNAMGINTLGGKYYGLPTLSISVVGLPFIAEGIQCIFLKMRGKKEKIIFFLSAALILFLIFVPLGSCIFNAFQYPFGRYTFVILPVFLILFCYGFDKINNLNRMNYILSGLVVLTTAALVMYAACAYENDSVIKQYNKLVIILNVGVFFVMWLITKYKKGCWKILLIILIIVGAAEESRITSSEREVVDGLAEDERARTTSILEKLQKEESSFVRIEKIYNDFSPWGDPIIEDYASTGGYCSDLNRNLGEFYRQIWPEAMVIEDWDWVTDAKGYITKGLKEDKIFTLLGVKYILSDEEKNGISDEELKEILGENYEKAEGYGEKILVYKNKKTNSIVTGFEKVVSETEFEKLPMAERKQLVNSYLVLEDEKAVKNPYYVKNINKADTNINAFDNHYRIECIKDSYYAGELDLEADKMLLFTIPYRTGWNIYIDGMKAERYKSDYGFISCQAPKGKHVVEVKYENKAYPMGIILSLAGMILTYIYFFRGKFRRANRGA